MRYHKMTHLWSIVLFFCFAGSSNLFASEYNVLQLGASGTGEKLDTEHIQKAIDRASIAGGIVIFPAGKYLTGTLYLKSNVTLRIQKGATILGSTDLDQYPENLPDYTFFRKGIIKRALIYAEKLENISIEGEGTIDGQGFAFEEPTDKNINSYSVRPYVIWMIQCNKVKIDGIKLQNSALWMQHYLACENLYIHNIEVYNHSNKNNDMMDIDGCKNVIISDCKGDTDDDGITIKSTHAKPNENITITNCILSSHCNAIKCGTESNAGFKNITISNCVIRPSEDREVIYGKPDGISGISLEVVDGAEMKGVNISNIVMDGPAVPLFVRLGNRARGYDNSLSKPEIGSIQDVMISNITAYHAQAFGSSITGIPDHPLKNITLENVRIYYSGGGSHEDGSKLVDDKVKSYPEATMFGNLPAFGLYIRHAENINLSNIEFYLKEKDERSPIILDDVKQGKFTGIRSDMSEDVAFIKGINVMDIYLQNPWPSKSSKSAVEIYGSESGNIRLSGIDKRKFSKIFEVYDHADPQEISVMSTFD
jgi:polygalacturonase